MLWLTTYNAQAISCSFNFQLLLLTKANNSVCLAEAAWPTSHFLSSISTVCTLLSPTSIAAPLTHASPTDNCSHFHQPLLPILVSALSPKCTDPFWVMQTATYLLMAIIPRAASWEESFHEEDTLQCKWHLTAAETPRVMLRHPSQLCLTLTCSVNALLVTSCKIKMSFNTPGTGMVFSRSKKIFQSLCCNINVLSSWFFSPPRSFFLTLFQQRFMFRPLVLACLRDF